MNANMAALTKGALSVIVVVALAVVAIATLMRMSPDAGPRAGRGPATAAGAAATAPPAPTPASGSASRNQAPAPAAPAASAGPNGARTSGQPPTQAAAAPPRTSTDFSPADEPWRHALAASTDNATALNIANGGKSASGLAGCSSCHGAQGIPAAGAAFPALAGSSPEYLAKQLMDYRSGARQNVIMASIAKGLDEGEIGALARYYGSLPGPALPTEASSGGRGQQLHDFGDNGLALAACANCHGARGAGESPLLPRLAGQPTSYFNSQMEAFRTGSRTNDDVGTMRAIAQRLTPADTAALAQYYAGPQ